MTTRISRHAVRADSVYWAPKGGFDYPTAARFLDYILDTGPVIAGIISLAEARGHTLTDPVPELLFWWERHRYHARAARASDASSLLAELHGGPAGVAQPGGGLISGSSAGMRSQ